MFLEIEKTNQSLIKKEQEASENLDKAKQSKEEFDTKLKELKPSVEIIAYEPDSSPMITKGISASVR